MAREGRLLLGNTRKTGRVRTAAAESSFAVWRRGTAPFALRRKTTAWLNLLAGLIWLSIPLRNIYLPGFPRVAHLSHPHGASLTLLQVTAGVFFLAAAWMGFSSIGRNPEGKTEPAIQTLFGP